MFQRCCAVVINIRKEEESNDQSLVRPCTRVVLERVSARHQYFARTDTADFGASR